MKTKELLKILRIDQIYEQNLYTFALKKILDHIHLQNVRPENSKQQLDDVIPNKESGLTFIFNNERLEFLGDGLLQSLITEMIFHMFPQEPHGSLSSLRSRLVRNSSLAQIIEKMNIVASIAALHGIDFQQLRPISVKNAADTFEALIGASFIDRGYEPTRLWVREIYKRFNIVEQYLQEDNYLDILQIYTSSSLPPFHYKVENQMVCINLK